MRFEPAPALDRQASFEWDADFVDQGIEQTLIAVGERDELVALGQTG